MSLRRRAVEPADITRIRWVSDVQISPDGARVAFVVTTLDTDGSLLFALEDHGNQSIWRVAPDGAASPVITGERDIMSVSASRDGGTLAYAASDVGKPRHRLERFRIILDWFQRYLSPGGSAAPTP